MSYITSKILSRTGVIHGFGMAGVSLADHLHSLCITGAVFFNTNQLHSDVIALLDESRTTNADQRIIEADAFVTVQKDIVCYIRTADCVPILMHDPVTGAIAAVHAGWRGTALRITSKVIDCLIADFGSKREDICVAIGPAIGRECYESDLQAINRAQLVGSGISNMEVIPICSHCDTRFASYRRDKTEARRQVSFICLRRIPQPLGW